MNVLVFGAQGSGKSTHARYIAEKLNVPYIYTGNLFRELARENSSLGQQINERITRGLMIPNPIAIEVFNEHLRQLDLSKGVVLDGYPRNFSQARSLPIQIDTLICITLPEEVVMERLLKRGRSDDTPVLIKTRLDLYKKETAPLIKLFEDKGARIVQLDNTPPIEIVRGKLDDLLKDAIRNRNNV
ncbi:MAG: hypothetical protein A2Z24_02670 [Candidatus Woykebacteria bacterium RBG_16_44_10]|uniref:Adenylate kinase n=1 Tax=Candidatus Woykebacteria bacterium RBG_16_44_10 TaxID=1802597 RepID=A0A1G1WEB2_9BACT|nr:MAG: hypothetical protein A2Z24_02670 [Candidatus Woykebacteria bacterium RBG_16_44_10]